MPSDRNSISGTSAMRWRGVLFANCLENKSSSMKLFSLLALVTILISCKNQQYQVEETSLSGQVISSQLKYLDKTIRTYADVSEIGKFYNEENDYLDEETLKMKEQLSKSKNISDDQRLKIIHHFKKICSGFGVYEFDIFDSANRIQIITVSDVELFRLYVKNYMVASLLNNKLLPKDIWETMASSESFKIKSGQEFKVSLATIACNRQRRDEWFLVKENLDEPLTKENIIDTLFRDGNCEYHYQTKRYRKGENNLIFVTKIPYRDHLLSRTVTFFVE
jgi:hypothetical protein